MADAIRDKMRLLDLDPDKIPARAPLTLTLEKVRVTWLSCNQCVKIGDVEKSTFSGKLVVPRKKKSSPVDGGEPDAGEHLIGEPEDNAENGDATLGELLGHIMEEAALDHPSEDAILLGPGIATEVVRWGSSKVIPYTAVMPVAKF